MTMEDILDSVDEHLSLDIMDPIIFGTFNEFRIKNRSVFSLQNCTHDIKVSLPAPSKEGSRRLKYYLIMMLMYMSWETLCLRIIKILYAHH